MTGLSPHLQHRVDPTRGYVRASARPEPPLDLNPDTWVQTRRRPPRRPNNRRDARMLAWAELQAVGWALFAIASGLVMLTASALVFVAIAGHLSWR